MTKHNPAVRGPAVLVLKGNGSGHIGPIKPVTMAHFISCVLEPFHGNENLSQNLVRLEGGLAVIRTLRRLKEFVGRDFACFGIGAGNGHSSAQGDERGAKAGRAYEKGGPFVAKDGVITIVAARHQGGVTVFAEQAMAIAVIPATRPLAEIAADGANRNDLWTADAVDGGHQ